LKVYNYIRIGDGTKYFKLPLYPGQTTVSFVSMFAKA